jgi:molecular chaperone Hsp33
MTNIAPSEDLLTPFMLEGGHVRGRVVFLSDCANTILSRYDYPPHVVRLVGELLVVAAMLSANLKQEGIFTIQIRGKGLVPLVVVDAVYGGALRGYAEVSPEADAQLRALAEYSPQAIVGEGAYLAITLDPGAGMQRYQGIVGLEGDSIAAALSNYFIHSEQIDAEVVLAVSEASPWRAGGVLVERMPPANAEQDEANQEAWRYAQAITGTVKAEELIDPLMDAQTLLYRLFHEEGVMVYAGKLLSVGCRCSRERIQKLLLTMNAADRSEMLVDGTASVHCQFCNKSECFLPTELGVSMS